MTSYSYDLIKEFYGEQKTERSQVPLINHIDEGLKILECINVSSLTKDADCINTILQSDESLKNNWLLITLDCQVTILAMEYRRVANSYLSKNKLEDFVGFSLPEVRDMLIADKVQNYKDFLLYHKKTHERSKKLDEYFNNWFKLLEIDYLELVKIIE